MLSIMTYKEDLMSDINKIKYGLRNVHVFPLTTDTPEETVYEGFEIPGA